MSEQKNEEKDLLLAIWGKTTLCKIYQALDIFQIKFSFAEIANPKDGIDCYMKIDDFQSDFIDMIRTGELRKLMYAERKRVQEDTQSKYCNDIWKSKAGKGSNGIVRSFSIQPGLNQELVIKAMANKKTIIVGMEYRMLKLLEERWSYLEEDYKKIMKDKYSLQNMKNEYHSSINKKDYDQYKEVSHDTTESEETQSSTQTTSQNVSESKPKPKFMVSGDKAKNDVVKEDKQQEASNNLNTLSIKLKAISNLMDCKSGKCAKVKTLEGETYAVIFSSNQINKVEPTKWKSFETRMVKPGVEFTIIGAIKEGNIYFKEFAA